MRKIIFKFLVCVLSVLCFGVFSACGDVKVENKSNDNSVHVSTPITWSDDIPGEPVKLVYRQDYEVSAAYDTTDKDVINKCVEALKNIKVKSATDEVTSDADDILTFTMDDGGIYTVAFQNGNLLYEGKRYELEGFEDLFNILAEIATSSQETQE